MPHGGDDKQGWQHEQVEVIPLANQNHEVCFHVEHKSPESLDVPSLPTVAVITLHWNETLVHLPGVQPAWSQGGSERFLSREALRLYRKNNGDNLQTVLRSLDGW